MISSTLHSSIRASSAVARSADVPYSVAGRDTGAVPLIFLHDGDASTAHDLEFVMPLLGRHRLVISIELADPAEHHDHIDAVLACELDADRPIAALGVGRGAAIWCAYAASRRRVAAFIGVTGCAPSVLAPVSVPTLVIGAEDDRIVTGAHTAALLANLAHARCAWVPGGHAVLAERPAQIISLVDDFLENPTRYAAGSIIPPARP